jgi:HEPN domain-containing protein
VKCTGYNSNKVFNCAQRHGKLDSTGRLRYRNCPSHAGNRTISLCDLSLYLALEKLLKAHVAEVIQTLPIKTHDLIYLVKKSELDLPEKHLDFVGKINTASIPTRYPDDLQRALKEYPKSVAKDYLDQTTELVQWLKQHPNLSK